MVSIDNSVNVNPEMFDMTFEGNIIIASSQVVIVWHADIVVKAVIVWHADIVVKAVIVWHADIVVKVVIVRHTDPSARSSQMSFSFVIVQLQPIGWLKTSVIK